MKEFVLVSLLALALLPACSEESSKKSTPVSKPSPSIVRRGIPKDVEITPPAEEPPEKPAKAPASEPAKKLSRVVYAKTRCNIRKGPGTKYSIIRKADKGEKLEYISLEGNWYKLRVPNGRPQEWVHKSVVVLPEKSQP